MFNILLALLIFAGLLICGLYTFLVIFFANPFMAMLFGIIFLAFLCQGGPGRFRLPR